MGVLASEAGCKVETVRYYEKIGLMPEPSRSEGGHRLYALDHVKRMIFIRKCRKLGFSIEQVKNMLRFIDEPNHACGEVKAMAMQQAAEVKQKIKELKRLESALYSMADQCVEEKSSAKGCPIIDALFKPEQ